jgi:hypothetical protein
MMRTLVVLLAGRQRAGGAARAGAGGPDVPAVEQQDHVLDEALRRLALGGEPGRAALLDVRGRGELVALEDAHAMFRWSENCAAVSGCARARARTRAPTRLLTHLLVLRQVREHVIHVV